jgi:hypothetical protein
MPINEIYSRIIDIGEQAERMADILLRQTADHNLHRVGVCCRDLSNTVAQALSQLSDETRKKIANA